MLQRSVPNGLWLWTAGEAGLTIVCLPVFSDDGAHVAFLTVKGNAGLIVLDGKEGPLYDYIPSGPVFRKDGYLEYLAVRGDTLYRVTVPVPSRGELPSRR